MTEADNRVVSPCIRNCCLNEQDVCLGCFRSLQEICNWAEANDAKRQEFLINAERRRQEYRPIIRVYD